MTTFYVLTVWSLVPLFFAILALFSHGIARMAAAATSVVAYVSQDIIQLVALPLLQKGQNLQQEHSELRAEATYKLSCEIHELLEKLTTEEAKRSDILHEHLEEIEELEKKELELLDDPDSTDFTI